MSKFKAKGLKTLKLLHLIAVICWISGAICVFTLLMLSGSVSNEESLVYIFDLLEFIDNAFIIIGALTTVLIGMIYGVFTNWGFIKHRWIAVKWIFALAIIVYGTMVFLPAVRNMQELVIQHGLTAMQDSSYQALHQKLFINSLFNMIVMTFIIWLSCFRPKLDRIFRQNKKVQP